MVPQWKMDFSKVKVPMGCIVLEFYQRQIGRASAAPPPSSGSRGV